MQAVIDSIKKDYFRCLLENGDIITLHKSELPKSTKLGNILKLTLKIDKKATKKQQELMKSN